MAGRYCRQFALYVFFVYIADLRHVLNSGFPKLLAFLVFAFLLSFALGRAAQLWDALKLCCLGLSALSLAANTTSRWLERQASCRAFSNEPTLSPLFQRPPPAS